MPVELAHQFGEQRPFRAITQLVRQPPICADHHARALLAYLVVNVFSSADRPELWLFLGIFIVNPPETFNCIAILVRRQSLDFGANFNLPICRTSIPEFVVVWSVA